MKTRTDKAAHSEGCILIPHQGVCVVADPNIPPGQYVIMGSPPFLPKSTGDTDYDQITAALRVAPGSTHIWHEHIWTHKRTGRQEKALDPRENPDHWKRQVRVYGQIWSAWVDA